MKKTALFLIVIIILLHVDLSASKRRMVGGGPILSWASSYVTLEAGSVTVQDSATWTYATAMGMFFDYMVNPYISYRTDWFVYPAVINSEIGKGEKQYGVIEHHAVGFSLLRHFNFKHVNPWFGAGPYLQFSTVNDVDSYIIHLMLSTGFDYEIYPDTYLCPEFKFGIGTRIISSNEDSVVIDVPGTNDFSTSGIIIFLKIGIARVF